MGTDLDVTVAINEGGLVEVHPAGEDYRYQFFAMQDAREWVKDIDSDPYPHANILTEAPSWKAIFGKVVRIAAAAGFLLGASWFCVWLLWFAMGK